VEWPKLKNIILIILLITNLFLLGLVGLREWNASRYEEQARADAVQVLEQNGIRMELDALPEDQTLLMATVTREREKESKELTPLLGAVEELAEGGGRYRYTGEKGEATILSRGEFVIYLNEGAYPLSGTMEEHSEKILAMMGLDAVAVSSWKDGAYDRVSLLQCWNGVPVRTCQIEVTYFEGDLRAVTGTQLSGTPQAGGEVELSAVTGLLRFLELLSVREDDCGRVNSMQAEYQFSTSLTEVSLLLPVWCFETDTGSYILDMTSNQLKKI